MTDAGSADGTALTPASERSPLAIICGGGSLPFAVADAAWRGGRPVFLLAIKGWADPRAVERYPHAWLALGQAGRVRDVLLAQRCRDVVCVGTLLRPRLRAIRLDGLTIRLLPRLYRLFRGGDDHLLSGIAHLFEEHGFRLVGAHQVAPEILVPEGALGTCMPTIADLADAQRGFALIDAMGPFDVGQAAVIAANRVLAVEAAEGTDAMLARVAELRSRGRIGLASRIGVLVKAPKPAQDHRIDLPSIGPATVAAVQAAGLAGIVVRAGSVIVAEPERVAAEADRAGLFVAGVASGHDVAS
jgi:DUF1009 family protein